MKKTFKKFLGGMVAAVVLAAGLSIGMATTAMAADGAGNFSFDASIFYGDTTNTNNIAPNNTTYTEDGKYTAAITSGTKTFAPGAMGAFASSKNNSTLNKPTDFPFKREMKAGGSRTITITPVNEGTLKIYVYHDGSKTFKIDGTSYSADKNEDKFKILEYTVNCKAGQTVTLEFETNIVFAGASFEEGTVKEYTWKLDTDSLTINIDKDKLSLKETKNTSKTNTLLYSGDDYLIVSGKEEVSGEPDENNVITVTVQDDWFVEKVTAKNITDKATLIFDNEAIGLVPDEITACEYFTLIGLNSSCKIENRNKEIKDFKGFTTCMNFGGATKLTDNIPENRTIKFTTNAPGAMQVVFEGGGTGRTFTVYKVVDGVSTKLTTSKATVEPVQSKVINLDAAATYYIAGDDNIRIYSVNVVLGDGIKDNASGGKIYSDSKDSYLIAAVDEADLKNSTIAISASGKASEADTAVYSAALIDGNFITAEDIGSDYIYVVKANNGASANIGSFDTILN